MSGKAYELERAVALAAVCKAAKVAEQVQRELVGTAGVQKKDKSPVTVGDYTAQALVTALVHAHFPSDAIVGEEDSAELTSNAANDGVRAHIVRLANDAVLKETLSVERDEQLWAGIKEQTGGKEHDERHWLELIDRGTSQGGPSGRHWAIDPIDGTKGFLRGGQYAVCVGLLIDGQVTVGAIACPNLPLDPAQPDGERGVAFVAVKGQGAFQRAIGSAQETPIKMRDVASLAEASFCESVESGHSDQSTNARIASLLGITRPSVRMDSQAKYCSVARGDGDVYLRLPVSATYEEKIWDHSSGSLLVQEAGGTVSDMHGKPLDFAAGRTLKNNKGVIVAHRQHHAAVIDAVKQAVAETSS